MLSHTPSVRRIPPYAIAVSELKATKSADAEMAAHDLIRADPKKDGRRKHADCSQHAVVGHDDETAAEDLFRDGKEFIQHRVAKDRFRRRRFHRFDSFDRIDLMRTVFSLALLNAGEKRAKHLSRKIHQAAVERSGGEKRKRQVTGCRATSGKARPAAGPSPATRRCRCCTANCAHLPRAIEAPLNIAGAPAGEIGHRQRQQLAAKEIENGGVEPHGREREQIFLRERRGLDKKERRAHSEQDRFQQSDIFFDDDLVDHHFGEDGKEQLQES